MLTRMRYSKLVLGFVCAAIAIAACGGGSSGGGTTTVTGPTSTQLTVADAAPSLGEEIASVMNAALRAGTASARPEPGTLAAVWHFFVPVLHAQSGFVANCSRGGSVTIRYSGFRPVVLTSTAVEFTNCGMRGRDAAFAGTLTSNGHWTAGDPGPISVSGTVTSTTIVGGTPIAIDAAVLNITFNGRVGGITVGAADTPPPPNPNSCPGTLAPTAITAPQGGGAYSSTLTVGPTCSWSVTSAPTWVTITSGGGRGNGTISFTVSASDGNQRAGSITVNNMNITINQLGTAAAGPEGRWSGVVSATNPCSTGSPVANYNWTGTITRSGNTYSISWRDDYFESTLTRTFPVGGTSFTITINDSFDSFLLTGNFASDFQSLTGTVSGSIDCVVARRPTTGSWTGRRLGP